MKRLLAISGVLLLCVSLSQARFEKTKTLAAKSGNCSVKATLTTSTIVFPFSVLAWGYHNTGKPTEVAQLKSLEIRVDGAGVYTPKSAFVDLDNLETITVKKTKEPFFYTITLKNPDYTAELKTGGEFLWERKVWRNADPFRNETTKYHYLEHDAK